VLDALLFRVEICEFLLLGVGLEGLHLHGLGALEQLDGLALEHLFSHLISVKTTTKSSNIAFITHVPY
jgi:hypothetical protein